MWGPVPKLPRTRLIGTYIRAAVFSLESSSDFQLAGAGAFVKLPRKIALVFGILALVVCVELVREYTASMRGRLTAHFDVWRGHYVVLAYGLPPPRRHQYAQLMRERYGIEIRTVALCIVSETLRSYVDSFDEVSHTAANQKFGHDVFKECAEVARSKWELQRAPLLEKE